MTFAAMPGSRACARPATGWTAAEAWEKQHVRCTIFDMAAAASKRTSCRRCRVPGILAMYEGWVGVAGPFTVEQLLPIAGPPHGLACRCMLRRAGSSIDAVDRRP